MTLRTTLANMMPMTLAESGLRLVRGIRNRFFPGSLILIFSVVTLGSTATWDRQGAERALKEARVLRDEIAATSSPTREQCLRCVRSYREVYAKDPHFPGCDAAIYEQGVLYEEMGDKFGTLDYYKRAARLFRFLVSDYGGSRFCPDALLRLGDLCMGPLEDPETAQKAYEELRSQYKQSKAARTLAAKGPAGRENGVKIPAQTPNPVAAPRISGPSEVVAPPSAAAPPQTAALAQGNGALVQNIRYWTTSDYTRVVIDMEGEARYHRTHLSNPDRIYFDISDAKLSHDLLNRKFKVGDDLLKQVRVAQNRSDLVRVVLDFAQVSDYSVFELHDPFRIIIDINGTRTARSRQSTAPSGSGSSGEPATAGSRDTPPPAARQAETPPRTLVAEAKPPVVPPKVEAAAPARGDAPPSSPSPREIKAPPAPPRVADGKQAKTVDQAASAASKVESAPSPRLEAKAPQPPPPVSRTAENRPPRLASIPPPAVKKAEPAVPPKAAAPTSRGDRTLTRMLGLKIGRIVIDPGHGGHDTGTIGPGGLMEKNLVLEVAKDLRKLIDEKLGASVVLTRNDDSFISLEERTAIANQHQADLFISIHANSSNFRSISGVETYYLDFARSASEREVAARENATTVRNIHDLENLVKKIALADKSAESRELAAIIQKKLYVGAQKLFPAARNRGVRSAPFVVLIGANMPSVLAEVAFISNPRDETLLKKGNNRERLAMALFNGIEGYMKTLGSDVAQNHSGSH